MPGCLHHISLTCRDLSKSLNFYEKIGFKIEHSHHNDKCVISWLKLDDIRIELFFFSNSNQQLIDDDIENYNFIENFGITHFALQHEELDQYRTILIERGIFCSQIKQARMGAFSYFFVADPDGNRIEFLGSSAC